MAIEADSIKRSDVIRFLKSGLLEVGVEQVDRELLLALQQGLERWAGRQLFPASRERVFVCEYVSTESGFQTIDSFDSFLHSDGISSLSPISRDTVLIPSIDNTIQIVPNDETLELVIRLRPEAAQATLSHLPEDVELELYCAADNAQILKAFEMLTQGRWPRDWALPEGSLQTWPRTGLREMLDMSDATADSGSLPLLSLMRHAGDSRFVRLPLANLHADMSVSDEACEYRMTVGLGPIAAELAVRLQNRVKVNHVAFWNRHLGLIDRKEEITRDEGRRIRAQVDRGHPLLVIECRDKSTNMHFFDARWSTLADWTRCFQYLPSEGQELHVEFAAAPPKELHILYLAEDECGQSEQLLGSQIKRGTVQLSVKAEVAQGDFGQLSVAWWLSRGYVFPPVARIVTLKDLKGALWDILPHWLLEMRPSIGVRTVMRREVSSAARPEQGLFAYPVTIVTLTVGGTVPSEDSAYHCEWLSRKLSSMCPLGTVVAVDILSEDGRGSDARSSVRR